MLNVTMRRKTSSMFYLTIVITSLFIPQSKPPISPHFYIFKDVSGVKMNNFVTMLAYTQPEPATEEVDEYWCESCRDTSTV